MRCTRTTMRSERSRSSRTSTKPAMSTFQAAACRTGCAMRARLSGRGGKAGRTPPRAPSSSGKRDRPPLRARTRADDSGSDERSRRPRRGLALGGEIEDDAEAEGDRQPGHQPAGRRRRRAPSARSRSPMRPRRAARARPATPTPAAAGAARPPRRFPSARRSLSTIARPQRPRIPRLAPMLHRPQPGAQVRSTQFTGGRLGAQDALAPYLGPGVAQADGAVEHQLARAANPGRGRNSPAARTAPAPANCRRRERGLDARVGQHLERIRIEVGGEIRRRPGSGS